MKSVLALLLVASACDPGRPAAAATPPPATPATTCGQTDQPDCPLQSWMKANLQAAVRARDLPRLRASLEKLEALAPPDMPEWATLASAGVTAAEAGDLPAVRQSCGNCHDTYRARYRSTLRTREVSP